MKAKILVGLGHPAHFHLFKHTIKSLIADGYTLKVVITDKDILARLLDESGIDYEKLWIRKQKENLLHKALKLFRTTLRLQKIIKEFKPGIMIGTLTQMAFAGKLSATPFYFFGEDDITYTYLQCYMMYPFVTKIIAPEATNVGIFNYKKIAYKGYQKLAYLHPNQFTPNAALIPEINVTEFYTIIRLVDLNAYHDINASGLNQDQIDILIEKLTNKGKVYISSENKLPVKYEPYKVPFNIKHMHHALAFAGLFIGDSQSMTVEAAVLGVPALKFNAFKGKISVLNELENVYGLTYGFNTHEFDLLLKKTDELLQDDELKSGFIQKKNKMLSDKIDVTAYYHNLIKEFTLQSKYKSNVKS